MSIIMEQSRPRITDKASEAAKLWLNDIIHKAKSWDKQRVNLISTATTSLREVASHSHYAIYYRSTETRGIRRKDSKRE